MPTEARDHFERYYAEKLWAMLPEVFRDNDGEAEPPGVLRGFIETLAGNAAALRRSNDKLWDDQFIELCSEWAVPYIGELVGTRLVSALNRRGRRIDVAKTIYYRRRKGTPRILEELIADITGWEGKLVEEFRRLGRMRHGLDPHPAPLAGRFTRTPPGGWADLRNTRGADLTSTPFDEFHYTPDVRRPRDGDGRYGIVKLGFHLYRLVSIPLGGVVPGPGPNPGTFTLDPSGRDIPLFIRRHRTDDRNIYDWEQWQTAQEWELPGPLNCRVLNHAEYVITAKALASIRPLLLNPGGLTPADADAAVAILEKFADSRFPTETQLRLLASQLSPPQAAALEMEAVWEAFLAATLVPDCGKHALLPPGAPSTDTEQVSLWILTAAGLATREKVVGGNLANWTLAVAQKEWVVDPERGRLLWVGAGAAPALTIGYCYSFSGPIGAGGYDRAASITATATTVLQGGGPIAAMTQGANPVVVEIADSESYTPVGNGTNLTNFEFRAANFQRPYLRLTQDLLLDTGANTESLLTLEGLWIGAEGAPRAVELRGDYKTVILRHVTLDPGGRDAQNATIPPVTLLIVGNVETLVVDHSITGPIHLDVNGTVTALQITDSIVDGQQAAPPALNLPSGRTSLERVTVFGELDVEWLYASEALITGFADVTDTQDGCFRFSAVLERRDPLDPASPHSRVPHPFESYFLPNTVGLFTSTVFGQPGYAQLSEAAPTSLQRGAENGSEIGAFSSLLNPIKLDGLRAKIDEFAPFGVLPFYVFET